MEEKRLITFEQFSCRCVWAVHNGFKKTCDLKVNFPGAPCTSDCTFWQSFEKPQEPLTITPVGM